MPPRPRHPGLVAGACYSFRAWARVRKAECQCACAVLECAPRRPPPAANEASGRIRRRVDRGWRKVAAGNGCGGRTPRRRTAAKKRVKDGRAGGMRPKSRPCWRLGCRGSDDVAPSSTAGSRPPGRTGPSAPHAPGYRADPACAVTVTVDGGHDTGMCEKCRVLRKVSLRPGWPAPLCGRSGFQVPFEVRSKDFKILSEDSFIM